MQHALELALGAFATARTPTRITNLLRHGGRKAIAEEMQLLDWEVRNELHKESEALQRRGIGVLIFGDDNFPESLVIRGRPVAPILFYWGEAALFTAHGVGMCGSRSVSDLGLKAARACGEEVSVRGMAVISGYARGVDTETHLAALRRGGRTVIVLAEGINHFRIKQGFAQDFDRTRVLVVSQFPPTQPWGAYAAMARNHLIFGLGRALVVIEAGERGGTIAAGVGALKAGKPVFVLDFGDETPVGNRMLLETGGVAIRSRVSLGEALDDVTGLPRQTTLV